MDLCRQAIVFDTPEDLCTCFQAISEDLVCLVKDSRSVLCKFDLC